jgi:hypothetical protein
MLSYHDKILWEVKLSHFNGSGAENILTAPPNPGILLHHVNVRTT